MSLIDRVGRKPLLMVGAGGTGIALAGVATIYSTGTGQTLLLPALIGFILFFAISQGAVIWVYLSEIFPTAVRARRIARRRDAFGGKHAARVRLPGGRPAAAGRRAEEHTSEHSSLLRPSSAVFFVKKK